ncbi:hypothetical protein D9757_000499 [Collybiopsis confluens]|uniref:F-box domain-containing protein n=1 Tax=Collybiopsis confluens TaxID=2823264 RepID=A0A8H5MGV4_9AGAR|nr:hypothetical protein D9757_000499 [Collybiopsis confluens]
MLLTELPDDILFKVVQFLPLIDIILLRKTCRQFQCITLERTVWIDVYRNSVRERFLPPGPALHHSVHELERILIRAQKLDANWGADPAIIKRNWSLTCEIGNTRCMELYRGRYLALGGLHSFVLHDIHTQRRLYSHHEPDKNFVFWIYRRSRMLQADYDQEELFIPVGKFSKSKKSLYLMFWKIEPSGSVSIIEPQNVNITNSQMHIGYGYCMCRLRSGEPILFHIASQKIYTFAEMEEQNRSRIIDVVIMANHVVLVYSLYAVNLREQRLFDLYALPDHSQAQYTDTVLHRTHTGMLSWVFNETTCISSDIDADHNTGFIWLSALFVEQGLRALRITLNFDGSMLFHFSNNLRRHADRHTTEVLSHPYDSILTVIPGSRARGVARTASLPGRPMLALYNIHVPQNGDLTVDAECIWLPQLLLADAYTFDGLNGLLCTAAGDQVDILEFA